MEKVLIFGNTKEARDIAKTLRRRGRQVMFSVVSEYAKSLLPLGTICHVGRLDGAEMLDYPEAALEYYIDQAELRYKHYAEEGNVEYSELLESLGVSGADIENEAKKYVKEDLVQLAVLRAEGIALTDDEKIRLFDRYVKKYVDDYGYSEDYVRKNLTEEIYKSMLFDKMLEYLVLKNTFIVKE